MEMTHVDLRSLDIASLRDVAQVHLEVFPSSALTGLGHEAVRRYYEWQLTGPHDVYAVGMYAHNAVIGYCFGGKFQSALGGYVRKNRSFLFLRVLSHPWLVVNPVFRDRLRLALRVGSTGNQRSVATALPGTSEVVRSFGILAIATASAWQRRGVGQRMIQHMTDIARGQGYTRMHLTVDPDSMQAVRFYTGLGWQKVNPEPVWHGKMQRDLS